MDQKIINWALELYPQATFCNIVTTPWSRVFKLTSNEQVFYLKQTPRELFIEAQIIELLNTDCQAHNIPQLLARNHQLNCFIISACGDVDLRTHFNGVLQAEVLIKVLQAYKKIQLTTSKHIDKFLAINVPDWRIEKFPQLYYELVQNVQFLQNRGLSLEQIQKLQALMPKITQTCQQLQEFPLVVCLDHCDLNDKNMLINLQNHDVGIIDFGESVITHPLFSLLTSLQKIVTKYNLDSTSNLYKQIEQECLKDWFSTPTIMHSFLPKIMQLLPIYIILAAKRLIDITSENEIDNLPNLKNVVQDNCKIFLNLYQN